MGNVENFRSLKANEDLPRQYAQELGLDMVQFDKDMKDPARAGKILITKPNGSVVECMTWGIGWSQTVCYANCDDRI